MINRIIALPWAGIFVAVFTLLFGSLAADGIEGNILFGGWLALMGLKIENFFLWQLTTTFGAFLGFLICLVLLYKHRSEFQTVRGLTQSVNGKAHACLIMLLSPPNKDIFEFPGSEFRISIDNVVMPTTLEKDIEYSGWNWQQMLRGIRLHSDKLRTVYLITSQGVGGKKGSFVSRDIAHGLITNYFPTVEVHRHEEPVNFESFDDLTECLTSVIEHFKSEGFKDKDIVIDVTGGFKTTSIAGSVVTLNKKVTFQYVQTSDPYDVLTYDVEFLSPAGL